jgi:hypothetical protein
MQFVALLPIQENKNDAVCPFCTKMDTNFNLGGRNSMIRHEDTVLPIERVAANVPTTYLFLCLQNY